MARKPRIDVAGIHHVYARGNDQRSIFRDDWDREDYLTTLGGVIARMRWHCLAYCLMDNHVHLLVEIEEANLGAGMQRLHGLYAQTFNQRRRRSGHVFQGRYGNVPVTTDEQLWHTIAYVVRNPVEAGLCASPDDWPWSSHGAIAAGTAPVWLDLARVLSCLTGVGGSAESRYRRLVGAREPGVSPRGA